MSKNHRTVVFLEDYAVFKTNQEFACDGMLARTYVDLGKARYKTSEDVSQSSSNDSSNSGNDASKENNSKQKSSSKANNKK